MLVIRKERVPANRQTDSQTVNGLLLCPSSNSVVIMACKAAQCSCSALQL